MYKIKETKTGVINDLLGQTHSLACSKHRFHLNLFVLLDFEECTMDGRVRKQRSLAAVTVGRPSGSITCKKRVVSRTSCRERIERKFKRFVFCQFQKLLARENICRHA